MRPSRTLANIEALQEEAADFARSLVPKESEATLVALRGELGAGKTAFTQSVAKALGVESAVTSPTFVLAKSYPLPDGIGFSTLLHIDAYRLPGGASLAKIGFDEAMRDPATLIMLEWPEMVEDMLPEPDETVRLSVVHEGGRQLSYA